MLRLKHLYFTYIVFLHMLLCVCEHVIYVYAICMYAYVIYT